MAEPGASFVGIKVSVLVAAAAGSVASLIFRAPMTTRQMALAVLAGFATAVYLGPAAGTLLQHVPALFGHAEIELPRMYEAGVFLVGLSAMNIVPAWLRLADRFGAGRQQEGKS